MSDFTYYSFPTAIYSGPGARKKLLELLPQAGLKKTLLVTDKGLSHLPLTQTFLSELRAADLAVSCFSEFEGNPIESHVKAGVLAYQAAEADGIIAFGGGAALDVAKAIALMAHHPGDLFDYEDGKLDARPIDQAIPPIFALPTTAGTGSEVGRSSVISEDETHQKRIVFSPRLMPQGVMLDPELCLALPPAITAATGMDALTHLIESYLARGTHPMCDGIALEGLRLLKGSLQKAYQLASEGVGATPEHLLVREAMLNASMMGAVAFQKGLGVTHSCAHALSTVCNMHHGLANAIMLPYTMAFNLEGSERRFQIMADVINEPDFIGWLIDLKVALNIPKTLMDAGVSRGDMDKLVHYAMLDGCHQSNPRAILDTEMRQLFLEAMEG